MQQAFPVTLSQFSYCIILSLSLLGKPASNVYCQIRSDSLEGSLTHVIDKIEALQNANDGAVEASIEKLHDYLLQPLDLNTCTSTDLEALSLLDPLTARLIIEYRERQGPFISLVDLLAIEGISYPVLERIRPFVFVRKQANTTPNPTSRQAQRTERKKRRTTVLSYSFQRQLELPAGYSRPVAQGGYYGTPSSMYTRFKTVSSRGISLYVAAEKDPGEAIRWAPHKHLYGPDHLAIAVSYRSPKTLKEVIIGHYTVQFGQGLLFSTPFVSSKGSLPTQNPLRSFFSLRPSASRSEGLTYRGLASRITLFSSLDIFSFISSRKRDASLNNSEHDSVYTVTSLPKTGFHRTESELSKKGELTETLVGTSIVFTSPTINVGYAVLYGTFSHPFMAKETPPIAPRSFSGKHLSGWSLFGKLKRRRTDVSWEFARSVPGTFAATANLLMQPVAQFRFLAHWRKYSQQYVNMYGHGFGERSASSHNESGLYLGAKVEFSPHWQGSLFIDLYQFPNLSTNSSNKPSSGVEGFARINYSIRSWLSCYIQYRFNIIPDYLEYAASPVQLLSSVTHRSVHSYTFRLAYTHSSPLRIRLHIELKRGTVQGVKSTGILLYQDTIVRPAAATKIYLRFSIFDSNRNDTILYAFENDLQFKYGIRSFSGKGLRSYIVVRHSIFEKVQLELKFSASRFSSSIPKGTGAARISSDKRRDISGQIVWRI